MNSENSNLGFKDKDFNVIREPWNFYQILDGPKLKLKLVLERVLFKRVDDKNEARLKPAFHNVVFDVPENQTGPNGEAYSLNQIKEKISHESHFEIISEEWNEYIVEDGTKIRIKLSLNSVYKTSLFNIEGDPIYYLEHSQQFLVKPPSK